MVSQQGFGAPLPSTELDANETFGVRVARRGGTAWVSAGGELDVFTAPDLRTAFEDEDVTTAERLVIDLRGLDFLDSSGLAVILAAHERFVETRGEPARIVIKGSSSVEALFETIGARDYLALEDDPDALASAAS